jgi:hypothetical protein
VFQHNHLKYDDYDHHKHNHLKYNHHEYHPCSVFVYAM